MRVPYISLLSHLFIHQSHPLVAPSNMTISLSSLEPMSPIRPHLLATSSSSLVNRRSESGRSLDSATEEDDDTSVETAATATTHQYQQDKQELRSSGNDISSPTEQRQIDEMLNSLSRDELEIAARCNFEYLQQPNPALTRSCASQMAARFLRSKQEVNKALKCMKATIQFRKDLDVDGLRLSFVNDHDDGQKSAGHQYRRPLEEHLRSKMVYVQGYDKDGRATYIFEPYRVQSHDPEWTIKQHVWTLERAIACTKSRDKTVNAVINFNGFSTFKHAPPTQVGKEFMQTLRNHYAGHVNQIFIVDAPTTFLCLWSIFKPMLSRNTTDKIKFVSSNKEKLMTIGKLYSSHQATPWMLPTGRKHRELDVDEYLFETPFDKAFDE